MATVAVAELTLGFLVLSWCVHSPHHSDTMCHMTKRNATQIFRVHSMIYCHFDYCAQRNTHADHAIPKILEQFDTNNSKSHLTKLEIPRLFQISTINRNDERWSYGFRWIDWMLAIKHRIPFASNAQQSCRATFLCGPVVFVVCFFFSLFNAEEEAIHFASALSFMSWCCILANSMKFHAIETMQ